MLHVELIEHVEQLESRELVDGYRHSRQRRFMRFFIVVRNGHLPEPTGSWPPLLEPDRRAYSP